MDDTQIKERDAERQREQQEYECLVGRVRVHGDRVALVEVSEDNDSGLFFPPNMVKEYIICRVFAVGDGAVQGESKLRTMWLKQGDTVLLQFNKMMIAQCGHVIDGVRVLIVPQGDCIGTLDTQKVSVDTFHPTGNWVLCRIVVPEKVGRIFLPSGGLAPNTSSARPSHYFVECGQGALDLGLERDQEIAINPARLNLIKLRDTLHGYIDKGFVLGSMLGKKEEPPTIGGSSE
jgi:co-chaperonin GroES (HSP10)